MSFGTFYWFVFSFTQPFLPDDHWIQGFFPHRKFGLMIPSLLSLFIIVVSSAFVGIAFVSKPSKDHDASNEIFERRPSR